MIKRNSLVFIVEDDIACGKLIDYNVKKQGFENVCLFHDENECLENLTDDVKVIIADFRLNTMNGLTLINKARQKNPHIYTILFSGLHDQDIFSDEDTRELVDEYIMKGCEGISELIDSLNNWARKQYVEYYY
jgi:DNA-binding NtrC family response regulator